MLSLRTLFLLLLSLCSTLCAASTLSQFDEAVRWQLPADQYQEILVEGQPQVIIQHAAQTASPLGVVVLINEMGHNPAEGLLETSTQLNRSGWTTISMTPATLQDITGSGGTTATTPEMNHHFISDLNAKQFDLLQQSLLNQLTAIQAHLSQYSGFVIFVAKGTSAAWLTKLVAEQKVQADGLVLIGPYWPDYEFNQQLPVYIGQHNVPVLDLTGDSFNRFVQQTAEKRKVAAKQAFKVHYRQAELPVFAAHSQAQYQYISKYIIGWTRSMGW